jgi:hypothetical protein
MTMICHETAISAGHHHHRPQKDLDDDGTGEIVLDAAEVGHLVGVPLETDRMACDETPIAAEDKGPSCNSAETACSSCMASRLPAAAGAATGAEGEENTDDAGVAVAEAAVATAGVVHRGHSG